MSRINPFEAIKNLRELPDYAGIPEKAATAQARVQQLLLGNRKQQQELDNASRLQKENEDLTAAYIEAQDPATGKVNFQKLAIDPRVRNPEHRQKFYEEHQKELDAQRKEAEAEEKSLFGRLSSADPSFLDSAYQIERGRLEKYLSRPPRNPAGLIAAGNIDMSARPRVQNADGSVSSVRSMSIGTDEGEVLIPTVSDDGRIMSDDEAIEQYRRTGRHLGIFNSIDSANAYAEGLHNSEAAKLGLPRTRAELEQQYGPLQQFARYQLGQAPATTQAPIKVSRGEALIRPGEETPFFTNVETERPAVPHTITTEAGILQYVPETDSWKKIGDRLKPQASDEPLQAVIGPDGESVLVPRSQAAGKRPANSREQGRPVLSGDANRIADFDTSLDDLGTLRREIGEIGDTGTLAKLGAWAPNVVTDVTGIGTEAKKKQATIDRVKQVIGKALEGGVLRKEDEYKYEKILPTIADTYEVVQAKLIGLDAAIKERRLTLLDSLDDAGYEVGNYRSRTGTGAQKKPGGKNAPGKAPPSPGKPAPAAKKGDPLGILD